MTELTGSSPDPAPPMLEVTIRLYPSNAVQVTGPANPLVMLGLLQLAVQTVSNRCLQKSDESNYHPFSP